MDEQFLISALCYQVPACRINLATCHTSICSVEAYFLSVLHYGIPFLHFFGCRAKDKCSCGVSYVASMTECKVDYYHISLAKFSVCYFSVWQCAVGPSSYDQWI